MTYKASGILKDVNGSLLLGPDRWLYSRVDSETISIKECADLFF